MKIFFLIIASCILIVSSTNAQYTGEMIGYRIAAFYPDNFVFSQTLPSMALLQEPDSIGEIPENWTISPNFYFENGKYGVSFPIEDGTDLYGTGEVIGDLRRNNTNVILWNTDNYGYGTDNGKRLYQSHPWVLAVRSDGSAYGIMADHTWKQEIVLSDEMHFISEGPPFRMLVIERDSPQEVVMALAELTGKIELPPLWALGYHQCRFSYYPDSKVKEIADTFREKQIPCDVIWMDINYMNGFRIFTFDPSGFPDPAGVNAYLHERDFHSIWMIDPGVKKENGYFVYDQGTTGNYWVKNSLGNNYFGDVWPGSCAFPDFTMPETRDWWASLYPDFMATGIDGIWNDMNEPAVFNSAGGTMPVSNIHRGGGDLPQDVHLRYHNVYGMLMVSATREGILQSNPDKRPFVLTRANFLGGQRYAATWTGDNRSTWEHMKMSIPMALNMGLSAQPFSGPDIGGFEGSPGSDLLGQWMALGAFYPFARNHSSINTDPQEPWAYGTEIENVSRIALQRRYKLLPYLYSLFYESSQNGMPVMRPVFFADPADLELREEQEVFTWGDELLIIPSWSENPALPKGKWRNIYLIEKTQEEDSYQPLLKQRAGSIIPLAEVSQSTETYSPNEITLLIAPDENSEATGKMYTDAGDGIDYLSGAFLSTSFTVIPTHDDSLLVSCLTNGGILNPGNRSYRAGLVTNYTIFYSEWKNDSVFKIPLHPDLFATLTSPQNGEKFEEWDDILLKASLEGDLPVQKITFYSNSEIIGEVYSEPWELNWENVPKGLYNLKAVAYSQDGIQVETEIVSIQVGIFGSGEITYQLWYDIGGSVLVSDLTSQPKYPDHPDTEGFLNSFSTHENISDEFGTRVIGYVYPPVTGNYTFWIAGDDYCELWLSTDSTMAHKNLVAEVPGWTVPGEWEKYSQQHSAEIYLEAGKKYFVMALQKEAYNDDFMTVAWEFPGQSRQVIPGDFLSSWDYVSSLETISFERPYLSLYPNPANKEFSVLFGNRNGILSIYNSNGSLIFKTEIQENQNTLKFSSTEFENGIYFVKFSSNGGTTTTKLVILK